VTMDSIFDVVLNRYTLRGSMVGTRIDLEEALAFAADGKVKATIETQPLEGINVSVAMTTGTLGRDLNHIASCSSRCDSGDVSCKASISVL
jgi:hypothetical protein